MKVQLNELIEKIKNDGVKTAEENAERILSEAKEKAVAIIRSAEDEALRTSDVAKADAERTERSGTEALQQAGRDLLLTVRNRIEQVFNRVIKNEVSGSLDQNLMAKAILATVKNLSTVSGDGLVAQIPEKEYDSIEAGLRDVLATELANGVEIVPFKGLNAGFRISMKDGSAFYDFSDEELTRMLSQYLNPKLEKALRA